MNDATSGIPVALELVLAVLITPFLTYLIFFFQSKREKDDRFDEIRHQTYVIFTHQVIETLRNTDPTKAKEGLSRAWLHYESILLSSERSVITSCWDIRIAVERYVESLTPEGVSNETEVRRLKAAAWHQLHIFHVLARKELGLGDLQLDEINQEEEQYKTASQQSGNQ